jgi:hypothetical protein
MSEFFSFQNSAIKVSKHPDFYAGFRSEAMHCKKVKSVFSTTEIPIP